MASAIVDLPDRYYCQKSVSTTRVKFPDALGKRTPVQHLEPPQPEPGSVVVWYELKRLFWHIHGAFPSFWREYQPRFWLSRCAWLQKGRSFDRWDGESHNQGPACWCCIYAVDYPGLICAVREKYPHHFFDFISTDNKPRRISALSIKLVEPLYQQRAQERNRITELSFSTKDGIFIFMSSPISFCLTKANPSDS